MIQNIGLKSVSPDDAHTLAEMNLDLIRDEGSANPMGVPELEQRMLGFLANGYTGVLIHMEGIIAGYCLYRPEEGSHSGKPGIYLRQYYIKPEFRRQGLGRTALVKIIREYMADAAFVDLDVLECNPVGMAFWANAGFRPVYHRVRMELSI